MIEATKNKQGTFEQQTNKQEVEQLLIPIQWVKVSLIIAQLLTDHWLVCGEIASNKNSHASQTTVNISEQSSNLSNKTFKDILQKETAANSLKRNEFKAILPDLKKA